MKKMNYKCKANDAEIKVIYDDKIEELWIKIEGETSYTVVGYTDMQEAIAKAERKIKKNEWSCDDCKHYFTNPFDQGFCDLDFSLTDDVNCNGIQFKRK